MTPVWMIARRELRRRRGSLLVLVLLVAVVSSVTLATAAGARRSASALDRMLAATDASDFQIMVFGTDVAHELADDLRSVDGVSDLGVGVGTIAGLPTKFDASLVWSPDGSLLERVDRPVVLDGRMPDDAEPDEVAVNELAATELGLSVGDTLTAPTMTPESWELLTTGQEFPGFDGPAPELTVVGVVRLPQDLVGNSKDATALLIATPAFGARYGDEMAVSTTIAGVSLDDLNAAAELAALSDSYSDRGLQAGGTTLEESFGSGVRDAVDVLVVGLGAFAALAALGGLIAIAQATSRQVESRVGEMQAASALGLTARQCGLALSLPAAIAIGAGVGIGALIALLASPLFPLAVARRAEVDEGFAVDATALIGGGFAMALLGGLWAYTTARRTLHRAGDQRRTVPRRGAQLGLRMSPAANLGLSRALGSTDERGPARTAVIGAAIGIAGVVAVMVVASSLDTALDTPAWWGWSWSAKPDLLEPDAEAEMLTTLQQDDDIVAIGRLQNGSIELAGKRVEGFALDVVSGEMALELAEGRLPVSDAEIAVGGETLDDLHLGIGDLVETRSIDGDPVELRIVGRVALPLDDNPVPGEGAAVTTGTLQKLVPEIDQGLVLTYADGVDEARLEQRLHDDYGLDAQISYADPQPPTRLFNVHEVVGLLPALGIFFVVLAALGLFHGLAVSTRSGRFEFGVLAALGVRRRDARRVVTWHATDAVGIGLLLGLPAGVILGRAGWRLIVADIGMLGGPVVPWLGLAVTVTGALACAVLLAWPIGRHFSKDHPADLLRVE